MLSKPNTLQVSLFGAYSENSEPNVPRKESSSSKSWEEVLCPSLQFSRDSVHGEALEPQESGGVILRSIFFAMS